MKKVTIIGSGDSGYGFENHAFSDSELWGINNFPVKYPSLPWTRVFEIHTFSLKENGTWLRKGQETFRDLPINTYIATLNNLKLPIYILPHTQNPFTNSVTLPIEEWLTRYRQMFSSTVAYQIVLAIEEGFSHIDLVGIDMVLSYEYRDQARGVAYFIGLAEGKGIEVSVSSGSPIVDMDYLYALTSSKMDLWHQRITAMRSYINTEKSKHQSLMDQLIGSEKCLDTMIEFYTTLQKKES